MNEIKNKIITISGEPASGKSTVKKALVKKYTELGYNVHEISTGDMFREVSIREYKKVHPEIENPNLADVQNDEEFATVRGQIDQMIDSLMAERGRNINKEEKPNDVWIIDSRLAWHNIPDSYAVRLTINEKIAGMRVFNDSSRGQEDKYATIQEAIEKTIERKLGEISRYKERYDVDLANPDNYDLIVDTAYSNTDELADIIISGEKSYREEKEYPKFWASPVHFLPVQDPVQLNMRSSGNNWTIEEICESIKENGFNPIEGEINLDEYNGQLFMGDGNHRVFAALSAGKTLLPYYSKKVKEEPINIENDTYLSELYNWADGIKYYGYKIGKNCLFEKFNVKNIIGIEKIPSAQKVLRLDSQSGDGR